MSKSNTSANNTASKEKERKKNILIAEQGIMKYTMDILGTPKSLYTVKATTINTDSYRVNIFCNTDIGVRITDSFFVRNKNGVVQFDPAISKRYP